MVFPGAAGGRLGCRCEHPDSQLPENLFPQQQISVLATPWTLFFVLWLLETVCMFYFVSPSPLQCFLTLLARLGFSRDLVHLVLSYLQKLFCIVVGTEDNWKVLLCLEGSLFS